MHHFCMYMQGSIHSLLQTMNAAHPLLSSSADFILGWKPQYPQGDITALKSAQ